MIQENHDLQMLIGAHSQQNVSDQLYQRISQLILSDQLPEGYAFPNENTLCEQLQVGRTTLREAYKALELSGYVTRTKRGTTVNGKNTILNATPLSAVFQMAPAPDFAEFRQLLESENAALAALHGDLADVQALETNLTAAQAARQASDYGALVELDFEFHRAISRAGKNELVIALMSVMNEAWQHSIQHNFANALQTQPQILTDMLQHHRQITDAIRDRKPEHAYRLMKEHITKVTAR